MLLARLAEPGASRTDAVRAIHRPLTEPASNPGVERHRTPKVSAAMFKDGTYSAWFKTPRGEGTGIVHFQDGKISGGDSIMSYGGSYQVSGDRFTAMVVTTRHTEGHATVFGIDDLELKLEGVAKGEIAKCTGTTDAAPGVTFEATLIRRRLESTAEARTERAVPKFDASKLPKLPPSR
ncbi:hypothetical protein [Bradyrhizobium sp. 143]|uniref:hypothetical protein n=1 Tax=unclassified Bradyrhizobium TaxID=2631580 RepID=UPI003209D486